MLIAAAVTLIFLRALIARADAYGAFLRGAAEGLRAAVRIAPALCAMLLMLRLMDASGLAAVLGQALAPVLDALHLPRETATVFILRPLTGSGGLSALQEVFRTCGVDSRAGRIASVLVGASETIFYTLTVYLAAAKVKRLPWVIPVSLASYLVGAWTAGLLL